jgi:hypothetical protein
VGEPGGAHVGVRAVSGHDVHGHAETLVRAAGEGQRAPVGGPGGGADALAAVGHAAQAAAVRADDEELPADQAVQPGVVGLVARAVGDHRGGGATVGGPVGVDRRRERDPLSVRAPRG